MQITLLGATTWLLTLIACYCDVAPPLFLLGNMLLQCFALSSLPGEPTGNACHRC